MVPAVWDAALLLARALSSAPPPRRVRDTEVAVAGVPGRLFLAPRPSPGLLLVAGVTPQGLRDPRLGRAGTALAGAGRTVFAPRLRLAERRLTDADVEDVGRAAVGLHAHPHVRGPLVGLGFSFGGSMLLLAAGHPRTAAHLDAVATFGAYGDLEGYLQALATGVSLVDGRRIPWRASHELRGEFRQHVGRLLREGARHVLTTEEVEELVAALDGRGEPPPVPVARAVHRALTHHRPEETAEAVAALPPELREALVRFSPVRAVPRLSVPLLALHSMDDPVVPAGELERLALAYPQARTYRVRSFRHVDPVRRPGALVRGGAGVVTLLRFATDVLRAGQPRPAATRRRPAPRR